MALAHVRPRLWNRHEYHELAQAGFLSPEERYELLEGEIFVVSPQGKKHRRSIILGTDILTSLFRETHYVCVQVPLPLSDMSEPEPDFALIPKSEPLPEDLDEWDDADLVLEVAQTSLAYDRGRKAALYALYGIPDYWILDVERAVLEVHREPGPNGYATRFEVAEDGSCAPLFAPDRPVAVADLLRIRR